MTAQSFFEESGLTSKEQSVVKKILPLLEGQSIVQAREILKACENAMLMVPADYKWDFNA